MRSMILGTVLSGVLGLIFGYNVQSICGVLVAIRCFFVRLAPLSCRDLFELIGIVILRVNRYINK
jgi:hypothetical protein